MLVDGRSNTSQARGQANGAWTVDRPRSGAARRPTHVRETASGRCPRCGTVRGACLPHRARCGTGSRLWHPDDDRCSGLASSWLRAFPLGQRSLDAPQLRLFEKFRSRSADSLHWQTEVPIPIPGDLRAADLTTRFGTTLAQVELITRLIDFQAQSRAARLKKRDLSAGRLFSSSAAAIRIGAPWPRRRRPPSRRFRSVPARCSRR